MIRHPPFYQLFVLFNNYYLANTNQSLILTTWTIIPFDHLEMKVFLGIFCFTFLLWIINVFKEMFFWKKLNYSLGKVPELKTINFNYSCNLSINFNILYLFSTFIAFHFCQVFLCSIFYPTIPCILRTRRDI